MSHTAKLIPALLLLLALSGCASGPKEKMYQGAPSLLPGTEKEMNTAGYWIGRHPDPDRVILNTDEIDELNLTIRNQLLVRNLALPEAVTGYALRKSFDDTANWIGNVKIYQSNGKKVNAAFMKPLVDSMAKEQIPEQVETRYGFVVRQTDLRVLPTLLPLYDEPGDTFIDNLQASSLEPGTPITILHQSRDGQWLYVTSELASGWMEAGTIALADRESFLKRYQAPGKILVVANKADIFQDEGMTFFYGYARMGTPLVPAETPADSAADGNTITGDKVRILLPARDENGNYREISAWVDASAVSAGYLPYTPRTIYRQAFRLLNAPYGWGGMFGEQDCSQFLCEIFATVGIVLPRNSAKQARVGFALPSFGAITPDEEKERMILASALAGATILRLPGHIMLYLGMDGGKPFAIHSTWAYREKKGFGEAKRLVNRVTVSSLDIGAQGSTGSLLHRLTTVSIVMIPPRP